MSGFFKNKNLVISISLVLIVVLIILSMDVYSRNNLDKNGCGQSNSSEIVFTPYFLLSLAFRAKNKTARIAYLQAFDSIGNSLMQKYENSC